MRALLVNARPRWQEEWGGDSTQLVETRAALATLGVETEVETRTPTGLRDFDVMHIFNLQSPGSALRLVRLAHEARVPVALSTIFWPMGAAIREEIRGNRFSPSPPRRLLAAGAGWPGYLAHRAWQEAHGRRLQQELLRAAHILLPNSHAELEALVQEFGDPGLRARAEVVPNGVRIPAPDPGPPPPDLPASFVLQAAKITPAKGQITLIEALHDVPEIPLVFAGAGGDSGYGRHCARTGGARGNVYFTGALPHASMPPLLARARVHALPSWRESPGLATLEAGVRGCNCVVSVHGPVSEYFGGDVWYCDPADPRSVRDAVLAAWRAPADLRLRERILAGFTWAHAARATLKGYARAVASHPGAREP